MRLFARPSVETLGCTVICSDKTGTLTTNQMTVVAWPCFVDVSWTVYRHRYFLCPEGCGGRRRGLDKLQEVCALCNQASIHYDSEEQQYKRVGEPSEAALRVFVEKAAVAQPDDPVERASKANDAIEAAYPRRAVLEFDRDRKSMSVLCGKTKNKLYVKGAPEKVLERCTHVRVAGSSKKLTQASEECDLRYGGRDGFEAVARARHGRQEDFTGDKDSETYKGGTSKKLQDPSNFEAIEKNLILEGVCGIKDPARPEVKPAIEACATAGIRVIMITGDTRPTAEASAREIGIFTEEEDITGRSFTGHDFFRKSEKQRIKLLTSHKGSMVFSRTEPKDKQALVKMLRAAGEVPAMTGDGVNDAPALKQASIGIAMGIAGPEVQGASDMILADDNFATIVAAVEEGRSIYSNMKASFAI